MDADDFARSAGYPPTDDDLDRANCERAGELGHLLCGTCEHGTPRFVCLRCLQRMANTANSQILDALYRA